MSPIEPADEPPTIGDDPGDVGMPAWVKAFLVVGVLVVLVLVIAALSGGGHGPGRHSG